MSKEFKVGDLVKVIRAPTAHEIASGELMWNDKKLHVIETQQICKIISIIPELEIVLVACNNAKDMFCRWRFAIGSLRLVGSDKRDYEKEKVEACAALAEHLPPIIAARLAEEDLRLQNITDGRAFRKWLMGSD